jgi:CRISPR-associated protein Cmr5
MSAQGPTMEQARARHALDCVRAMEANPGKYGSYVKRLPASILMNGLGQAVATLLAAARGKAEDPNRKLYDHMQAWLCGACPDAPYAGGSRLVDAIINGDQAAYVRAQAEALRWLEWLKKFAQAYLPAGHTDDDADENGSTD